MLQAAARLLSALVIAMLVCGLAAAGPSDDDPCGNPLSSSEANKIMQKLYRIDRLHADDAFQQAMLKFLERCRAGETFPSPRGWLAQTAADILVHALERTRTRMETERLAYEDPTNPAGARPVSSAVSASLAASIGANGAHALALRAPPEQTEVLFEKYIRGGSAVEIARRLNLRMSTVQKRLWRGELALREVVASTARQVFQDEAARYVAAAPAISTPASVSTPSPAVPFTSARSSWTDGWSEDEVIGLIIVGGLILSLGISVVRHVLEEERSARLAEEFARQYARKPDQGVREISASPPLRYMGR